MNQQARAQQQEEGNDALMSDVGASASPAAATRKKRQVGRKGVFSRITVPGLTVAGSDRQRSFVPCSIPFKREIKKMLKGGDVEMAGELMQQAASSMYPDGQAAADGQLARADGGPSIDPAQMDALVTRAQTGAITQDDVNLLCAGVAAASRGKKSDMQKETMKRQRDAQFLQRQVQDGADSLYGTSGMNGRSVYGPSAVPQTCSVAGGRTTCKATFTPDELSCQDDAKCEAKDPRMTCAAGRVCILPEVILTTADGTKYKCRIVSENSKEVKIQTYKSGAQPITLDKKTIVKRESGRDCPPTSYFLLESIGGQGGGQILALSANRTRRVFVYSGGASGSVTEYIRCDPPAKLSKGRYLDDVAVALLGLAIPAVFVSVAEYDSGVLKGAKEFQLKDEPLKFKLSHTPNMGWFRVYATNDAQRPPTVRPPITLEELKEQVADLPEELRKDILGASDSVRKQREAFQKQRRVGGSQSALPSVSVAAAPAPASAATERKEEKVAEPLPQPQQPPQPMEEEKRPEVQQQPQIPPSPSVVQSQAAQIQAMQAAQAMQAQIAQAPPTPSAQQTPSPSIRPPAPVVSSAVSPSTAPAPLAPAPLQYRQQRVFGRNAPIAARVPSPPPSAATIAARAAAGGAAAAGGGAPPQQTARRGLTFLQPTRR